MFLLLVTLSANVIAHESDREIQLKAANDELTKRVAELLDENAKLKAHTAKIQKQIREAPAGKPVAVSTGCINTSYDAFYDNFILNMTWKQRAPFVAKVLEQNGKACSKQDLDFIKDRLLSHMSATNFRLIELLNFYRSKI